MPDLIYVVLGLAGFALAAILYRTRKQKKARFPIEKRASCPREERKLEVKTYGKLNLPFAVVKTVGTGDGSKRCIVGQRSRHYNSTHRHIGSPGV